MRAVSVKIRKILSLLSSTHIYSKLSVLSIFLKSCLFWVFCVLKKKLGKESYYFICIQYGEFKTYSMPLLVITNYFYLLLNCKQNKYIENLHLFGKLYNEVMTNVQVGKQKSWCTACVSCPQQYNI